MHPHSIPSRQQFVRICECGCGQPTLLATYTNHQSGSRKWQPLRFLRGHHNRGTHNPRYKGRTLSGLGYVFVFCPNHPHANKDGCVQEHRLVMESHLGRYLDPCEVVHHRDENRQNNVIENLKLFPSNAAHIRNAHGRNGRWSSTVAACIECGSSTSPHAAGGLCRNCYIRDQRTHPERTWVRYPRCVECGTTSSYHAGRGLCHTCDERRRRALKGATGR